MYDKSTHCKRLLSIYGNSPAAWEIKSIHFLWGWGGGMVTTVKYIYSKIPERLMQFKTTHCI